MKRTIFIESILLFVLIMVILFTIKFFNQVYICLDNLNALSHMGSDNDVAKLIAMTNKNLVNWSLYGAFAIVTAIATLIVMVIIAIKDFPVFKPIVDKLNTKRDVRKEQRAERAAIAKQDRIAKLQAELDELKKDE